jgi:hypothetical protein
MLTNGITLLATKETGHWLLVAGGLRLGDLPAERWGNADAAEVAESLLYGTKLPHPENIELLEVSYQLPEPLNLPLVLSFQTRDRAQGLLQIIGFTENPRGVKLRYKLVQTQNIAAEPAPDFYIGQTNFPRGDSIEITSVERGGNQLSVKGHYLLVSADEASLSLNITSTNDSFPPEPPTQPLHPTQTQHISKGRGDFELSRSHLMPGLPHVSMYANGHSFAGIYFGTKAEALAEGKLDLNDHPAVTTDQIAVEDLALQMIVAIREKDNDTLKTLATDQIKGWREALPVFATELREHYRQIMGNEAFNLRASESLVAGDLAAVRCTGPAELQGKCLVMFFIKTADGWRNHSLRASMADVPLSELMANLTKEIEKEAAAASTPKPDGSPAADASQAAVGAAEKWLAVIDEGDYSQSWKDAAAFFQAAVTEPAWQDAMESVRKPLGGLVSRRLKSAQPATSLPGAPDGEYVVMQFESSFAAKKTAVETVTFTRGKDGAWRASGYYIR